MCKLLSIDFKQLWIWLIAYVEIWSKPSLRSFLVMYDGSTMFMKRQMTSLTYKKDIMIYGSLIIRTKNILKYCEKTHEIQHLLFGKIKCVSTTKRKSQFDQFPYTCHENIYKQCEKNIFPPIFFPQQCEKNMFNIL